MSNRLAVAALGLWGLTALGAAWWVYGPDDVDTAASIPSKDTREVIPVTPKERVIVGRVMRKNLTTISEILTAADRGDMEVVARIAKGASRSPGPGRRLPKLRKTLPPEWRAMGKSVHTILRKLGEDASSGLAPEMVPGRVAKLMATCVACHDTYRLVEVADGP